MSTTQAVCTKEQQTAVIRFIGKRSGILHCRGKVFLALSWRINLKIINKLVFEELDHPPYSPQFALVGRLNSNLT